MKELSDEKWVSRFQGSQTTQALNSTFRSNHEEFLRSLGDAGVRVTISATLRPPERASSVGNINIRNKKGEEVLINTFPRDGMNAQLHEVGKSFGVIKYHGGANDKPHWSTDGR